MHVCRTLCTKERKLDEQNVNAPQQVLRRWCKGRLNLPRGGMGNRKCWVKGRKGLDFAGELRHGGAVCVPGRCRADRMAVRVLRCSEQHGMFMAAHSANPVATSMEPITRTSSHVIVGLICSCGFQYTASRSEEASYRQGRRKTLNQPAFSPADSFGGRGLAPAAPGGISGGRGCYDGLWRSAPGSRDTTVPLN